MPTTCRGSLQIRLFESAFLAQHTFLLQARVKVIAQAIAKNADGENNQAEG